jgi:autotransporter-associated beta strand protein
MKPITTSRFIHHLRLKPSATQQAAAGACLIFAATCSLATADEIWTGAVNNNWDTTTVNWQSTVTSNFETWSNYSKTIFEGLAPGTVNVGAGLTSGDITFQADGYTLSGAPLNLGTGPEGVPGSRVTSGDVTIRAADGISATVNNLLTYTNTSSVYFDASNSGTLTFTGGMIADQVQFNRGSKDFYIGGYNNGTTNFAGGDYYGFGVFIRQNVNVTGNATVHGEYIRSFGVSNVVTVNSTDNSVIAMQQGDNNRVNGFIIGTGNNTSTLLVQQGTINANGGITVMDVDNAGVTQNNTGSLIVEGGIVNVGRSGGRGEGGGITLNNGSTALAYGDAVFTQSGGTVNTSTIRFGGAPVSGGDNVVAAGNSAVLNLKGGALYVGSGGIQKTAFAPATTTINLSGGTIGTLDASWSSAMNMSLSNADGGVKFQAANEAGAAFDITLSGVLDGSGGLTKTGLGVVTLNSTTANTFGGGSFVNDGTLVAATAGALGTGNATVGIATLTLQNANTIFDTATLYFGAGSAINLDYTGSDVVGAVVNTSTSLTLGAGTYTSPELNDFFGGVVFSGTGSLTIIPEPTSVALLGLGLVSFSFVRKRKTA